MIIHLLWNCKHFELFVRCKESSSELGAPFCSDIFSQYMFLLLHVIYKVSVVKAAVKYSHWFLCSLKSTHFWSVLKARLRWALLRNLPLQNRKQLHVLLLPPGYLWSFFLQAAFTSAMFPLCSVLMITYSNSGCTILLQMKGVGYSYTSMWAPAKSELDRNFLIFTCLGLLVLCS